MCIRVVAGIALQGLITQVHRSEIMRMVSQSSILKLRASSILEPRSPSPTHSHARAQDLIAIPVQGAGVYIYIYIYILSPAPICGRSYGFARQYHTLGHFMFFLGCA